jgi:fatty acid desaturase
MSADEEERDVVDALRAFHHRLSGEIRGEYGGRARTAAVRVAVLVVGLAAGGPLLWAALWSMPPALAVLIGLAVAVRVGRWWLRRYR